MVSYRAKIVRWILKSRATKQEYSTENIAKYRNGFERNSKILFPKDNSINTKHEQIEGVNVVWFTADKNPERTIVYLHGGGFILGSSDSYHQHLARLAKLCDAKVLSIDYSLAPENPFPSALDDILRVWRTLLKNKLDVSTTVIAGDSAGGNLVMASALRIRTENLPQPACLAMLSPALDATFSGESYKSNKDTELVLTTESLNYYVQSYVQNNSKENALISPVFAKLNGLPPFIIQVGSGEVLLSDAEQTIKNAKRDGVEAKLIIEPEMWHGWQLFAKLIPEARKSMQEIADYIVSKT
ncbi:MAG: alpha/beta hydrolase [bacterium]|nr:alpha/beta hydrolase [bacterium]